MNRTCDTRIRNPVLYPLSYGGNCGKILVENREKFLHQLQRHCKYS